MIAVGDAPAGLNNALFLVIAMGCAGAVHVVWMWLAPPGALQPPLDMNMTFRGRRLFGANKTLRGLVMMPLAERRNVAVQPTSWIWVLLLGPGVHAALSALMHLMGVKVRAF